MATDLTTEKPDVIDVANCVVAKDYGIFHREKMGNGVVVFEEIEEQRLGNIFGATGGNYAGWVYGKDGLAPTINTAQGGYRQPMVIDSCVVAMRGRENDNVEGWDQQLEPRPDDCTNAVTTVQKDNLVMEVNPMEDGTCRTIKSQYYKNNIDNLELQGTFGCTGAMAVEEVEQTSLADKWIWKIKDIWYKIRIRKLHPMECARLMGLKDNDFEAMQKVNSDTQLYKQYGNSIVKQVLMSTFAQFYEETADTNLEVLLDKCF